MKVILLQDVKNIGKKNQVVDIIKSVNGWYGVSFIYNGVNRQKGDVFLLWLNKWE